MGKITIAVLFLISTLFGDITTSTQKQEQKTKSKKEQTQRSQTEQLQHNKQLSKGKEKSISRSLTYTLNNIRSNSHTVARTKSGAWIIQLNPIPHILLQMRELGWNKKAFFLSNKDIGTAYFVDNDEDIIDLNAQSYYDAKAKMRGRIDQKVMQNIANYINLLNYSGRVAEKAANYMQHYPKTSFSDIEKLAKAAVYKAYKNTRKEYIDIYECRYGGNLDTYECNNGKYVLILTNSIPTLLKNGIPFYSGTNIGYSRPLLTVTFATNTNDAFTKLIQDQNTRTVAKLIRDYTSKLESKGKTKIAQEIKSKFIEKALNTNLQTSVNTVVNAINSGSPIAVLNIFK